MVQRIFTTATGAGPARTAGNGPSPASRRIQERLGPDRVSALMTTTEASLDRPRDIIDTYAEPGAAACLPAADLAVRLRAAPPRRRGIRRAAVAGLL